MSEQLDSVIAKVQKLFALAEGNKNEHEVKAALAAADRIMHEWRLTRAEVESRGEVVSEPFVRDIVSQGGRRLAWQEWILMALCTHYGGAFYFSSYRSGGEGGRGGGKGAKGTQSYTVLARKSDFEIIKYMFAYLSGEVDRLGTAACKGQGIKVAAAWRVGCAQGIASQFNDMREAARAQANTAGHSSAMVLLDKRHDEAKVELAQQIKLRQGKAIHGGRDSLARAHGYSEGRKIQIRDGISDGKESYKLSSG